MPILPDLFQAVARFLYSGAVFFLLPFAALFHLLFERISIIRRLAFDLTGSRLLLSEGRELFIVSATDKVIARRLYSKRDFDFAKLLSAIRLSRRQTDLMTLIDVGANIGPICIPALRQGLFCRAIAFEPAPSNFNLLKVNTILNDLEGSIVLHELALGANEGVATLTFSVDNSGDHRIRTLDLSNYQDPSCTAEVEISTLDRLISSDVAENAFIWVDTQGYEGFVLKGATTVLKSRPPLVLEFWPLGMAECSSYGLLKDALLEAGYSEFYDLGGGETVPRALTSEALDELSDCLGPHGRFTDILVL